MTKKARVFGMVSMQRSWEYSSYALKTFAKFTNFSEQDLFVIIDDGSFGGPPDWILPRVEVQTNLTPEGLAHNMNLALQYARDREADFYFFHNDVVFTDGWHQQFSEDRQSIITAITNQDVQYDVGGMRWGESLILTDYTKRAPILREVVKLHRQQMQGYRSVLSSSFVCVKIPPEVYSVVGDFDPDFGRAGGEDSDYCLRAIEKGFKVEQALHSYVLHFGSKSTIGGGEKAADTQARIAKYSAEFEKRWGPHLKRLIIDKDPSVLQLSPEIAEFSKVGDYKSLIGALKKL